MWLAQTDSLYSYSYSVDSTTSATGMAIFGGVWLLFWLAIYVVMVIAFWKVFTKAGQAGWKSIIPIYNMYVLLQIVGRPGWWIILYFIPIANIIVQIIVALDLAKAFGKSQTFGIVGLWLFSLIGYLILGFGDAKYLGAPNKPVA